MFPISCYFFTSGDSNTNRVRINISDLNLFDVTAILYNSSPERDLTILVPGDDLLNDGHVVNIDQCAPFPRLLLALVLLGLLLAVARHRRQGRVLVQ